MKSCLVCCIGCFALSTVLLAQSLSNPDDSILNVLVWGIHMRIEPAAYSGALRRDVEAYLQRASSYRPTREVPSAEDLRMVYDAWVNYERRLAAVSDDPRASELAREYVDGLRPCYEWEGNSSCPEHEALFADEYQTAHPVGPFSAYLPLLSAHRWLCAAEGFEYEQRPDDVARSRRLYQERLAVALRSQVLLVRTASERLSIRGRCGE